MTQRVAIFLVLLLANLEISYGNFTVQIMHQLPPTYGFTLRCFGALFDANQILVPASCLNPSQPNYLSVLFQNPPYTLTTNSHTYFMHPFYNSSNANYGNIGRIRVSKKFYQILIILLKLIYS